MSGCADGWASIPWSGRCSAGLALHSLSDSCDTRDHASAYVEISTFYPCYSECACVTPHRETVSDLLDGLSSLYGN